MNVRCAVNNGLKGEWGVMDQESSIYWFLPRVRHINFPSICLWSWPLLLGLLTCLDVSRCQILSCHSPRQLLAPVWCRLPGRGLKITKPAKLSSSKSLLDPARHLFVPVSGDGFGNEIISGESDPSSQIHLGDDIRIWINDLDIGSRW